MAARNRLQQLREAQGLTRRDVASQITSIYADRQVSERTVDRWERGETPIPEKRWAELSDIFGVSIPHLLGLDADNNGDGDNGIRVAA